MVILTCIFVEIVWKQWSWLVAPKWNHKFHFFVNSSISFPRPCVLGFSREILKLWWKLWTNILLTWKKESLFQDVCLLNMISIHWWCSVTLRWDSREKWPFTVKKYWTLVYGQQVQRKLQMKYFQIRYCVALSASPTSCEEISAYKVTKRISLVFIKKMQE